MALSQQYLVALLRYTSQMRTSMLHSLTDPDLAARVPGNPSLGELCREMGNVERCYIEAFMTRQLVWGLQRDDSPATAASVEKLTAWFQALDEEFASVLHTLPEADFQALHIERDGRVLPADAFYQNYHEALLIFCGRCSVYLRMLGKPLDDQWLSWIG